MAQKSYEIYSYKEGNWMIDSVHDDKNMALSQAKMLLNSRHHTAVKVIAETHEPETNKTWASTIFNEGKGEMNKKANTGALKQKKRTPATASTNKGATFHGGAKKSIKKDESFSAYLIKNTLILSVVILALLALAYFFI